jgi:hypothetical protein
MHMRGCLSLPGPPDKPLTFDTWVGASRLFSQALRLFCQTLIQWR